MAGRTCTTPGCGLAKHHAGCHSFEVELTRKRLRQPSAKCVEDNDGGVSEVAASHTPEAVEALGRLRRHIEACGASADLVGGWRVSLGAPRAGSSERAGRRDVSFHSPQGDKVCRSVLEVARHLGISGTKQATPPVDKVVDDDALVVVVDARLAGDAETMEAEDFTVVSSMVDVDGEVTFL